MCCFGDGPCTDTSYVGALGLSLVQGTRHAKVTTAKLDSYNMRLGTGSHMRAASFSASTRSSLSSY